MIKLIKQKRLIRRGLCNDYEIKKTYNTHRNKLAIETQRPFFLMEIRKTTKKLNQQYRYRRFGLDTDDTQKRKELAEKEIKKDIYQETEQPLHSLPKTLVREIDFNERRELALEKLRNYPA